MPHWLDTVIKIIMADTDNLRELATIAGGDPRNFYIGTKMDGADVKGQNLTGMKFSNLDLRLVDYDSETIFDDSQIQVMRLKVRDETYNSVRDYLRSLKKLTSQRNYHDAILLAKKSIDQFPESSFLWLFYIEILFKRRDYVEALAVISKALTVHINNTSIISRKIEILLKNKLRGDALDILREAMRSSPNDQSLLVLAYDIHNQNGTLPEILSDYENAVHIESDPSNIVLKLGDIYKKSGLTENAEHVYKTVIKNDPNNVAAWSAWSQFLFEQHRFSESIEIFSSYHINNNNVGIWKVYGDALIRVGSVYEAIDYYRNLFEEKKYSFQIVKWLGEAYIKANMLDEAVKLFKEAAYKQESKFFVWKWLFNALVEQNKYEDAISCMIEAKERYPKNKSVEKHIEYARDKIALSL